MRINPDVQNYLHRHGLLREFGTLQNFFKCFAEVGGGGALNSACELMAGVEPDLRTCDDAIFVNQAAADTYFAGLLAERYSKLATRIESFNYVKPDLPTLCFRCHSGIFLCMLAALHPESRFIGYDYSEPAIRLAKQRASDQGLTNVTFVCGELDDCLARAKSNSIGLVIAIDGWEIGRVASPGAGRVLHLQDVEVFRRNGIEISRVLHPEGRCLNATGILRSVAPNLLPLLLDKSVRCGLVFASKESVILMDKAAFASPITDMTPCLVFKKGAGSPVSAQTIRKLRMV